MNDATAIRKRPGMYVGNTADGSGYLHMALEILSNAVDAVYGTDDPNINISEVLPIIRISDNGNGLPFDEIHPHSPESKAQFYLENLHSTASVDGHSPHLHLNYLHGVGLAVINGLSEYFHVRSWRNGDLWECEYKRGVISKTPGIVESGTGVGTTISFRPDTHIFDDCPEIQSRLRQELISASFLVPRIRYSFLNEEYYSENGLGDLVQRFDPKFVFENNIAGMKIYLAIGGESPQPKWKSWVNGVRSYAGGSHHDAVEEALNKIGWIPKAVFMHVIGQSPKYAGPTKDKLNMPQLVEPLVQAILADEDFKAPK